MKILLKSRQSIDGKPKWNPKKEKKRHKETERSLMPVHFTDFKSNKLKYENEQEKTIIQIDKYAKCIWQYHQQHAYNMQLAKWPFSTIFSFYNHIIKYVFMIFRFPVQRNIILNYLNGPHTENYRAGTNIQSLESWVFSIIHLELKS